MNLFVFPPPLPLAHPDGHMLQFRSGSVQPPSTIHPLPLPLPLPLLTITVGLDSSHSLLPTLSYLSLGSLSFPLSSPLSSPPSHPCSCLSSLRLSASAFMRGSDYTVPKDAKTLPEARKTRELILSLSLSLSFSLHNNRKKTTSPYHRTPT